jgi:hypothetical protein
VYIEKKEPHCFRFDIHIVALVVFLVLARAGISIDIRSAIMAITTKSSINVNPNFLCISHILLILK